MKKKFFCVVLIAFALNASAQVTDGLIAKYSFTKNANDEAGNHNGNVFKATLTTDRFGKDSSAYQFDRDSSAYIEVPYSSDFTPNSNPLTVSVWFLSPLNDTMGGDIVDWYRCGANPLCGPGIDGASYTIALLDSSRLYFDVRDDPGTADSSYVTSQLYNDNHWHHAVLILNPAANFQEYYLDDQLLDSVTTNLTSLTDGGYQIPFEIGRHFRTGWGNPAYYFTGKIDDINIYSKALSSSQVDSLFRDGTLGVSSFEQEPSFSVFPNPTAGIIHIQNNSTHPFQFTLYNCLGEKIIDRTCNSKTCMIDLSTCSGNIYFYKITSGDSLVKTGKIIKQ